MADDLCRMLTESFLKNSWSCCIKVIVEKLANWSTEPSRRPVTLVRMNDNRRTDYTFEGDHFFLRGSVEYTNPQLTVEDVQGVVAARLLEVCGNYFHEKGLHEPDFGDITELCERLKKPPQGKIVSFLLNTDDVEPDRYSINPLKASLVASGQSAFPAANVKTDQLRVDENFVAKYNGTLVCNAERELISQQLAGANGSYLNFSDSVKYAQLEKLSERFGMDLALPALRMPLATLKTEKKDGVIHKIISETHRDFEAVKEAYACMGRSISNRTTLLTVPHSGFGFGSKRAARGKLRFDGNKLDSATVHYKTTALYPNAMDPEDVSIAQCEDKFVVAGDKLDDYSFAETPSSPQFFLYSLASPEDGALWHGVGAFAATKLVQSYASARAACREGRIIKGLSEYGVRMELPLQLNLSPDGLWVHPVNRNIDASIGCVEDMADLARMGMKIEHLPRYK
jgi:hypothetical protein